MNDIHSEVTERGTVRLERDLPGPVERVWEYLTDSEKRRTWLAAGPMELRPGGRVELNFRHEELTAHAEPTPAQYRAACSEAMTGKVTRCEPPRLLAMTWDEAHGPASSEVTFELEPRGARVRLTLTHRKLPSREELLNVSAGWHAHVGILIDRLEGREPAPFWEKHERLRAEYEARLAADAAG